MKATPPRASEVELALIKEYALLPIALTVLEHDKSAIQKAASLKMGPVYSQLLDNVMNMISHDFSGVRKELRKSGIKVHLAEKTKEELRIEHFCRGYQGQMILRWDYIKAELTERIASYCYVNIHKDG
ncbi:hypothetical protein J31TS4_15730 [Paenibacillus sp. J31TS4]|uniref:hypothetical protein n=1 Tax=Paenibacillus sp. J31TS4 TaxID=2807195 RepID=UPI001B1EADDD|nr:hypothetical protein [Paenibacillus sp. J31TS4]GIP38293.1 hypothetical protein J31TS4_15730 [Paenibacillus sp. J31TS4]